MKVWLEPIAFKQDVLNPYLSILIRIEDVVKNTPGVVLLSRVTGVLSSLTSLIGDAAFSIVDLNSRIEDIDRTADEFERQSRVRVEFPRKFRAMIALMDRIFAKDCGENTPDKPFIEWCVAISNPSNVGIEALSNFLSDMKQESTFTIYLPETGDLNLGTWGWSEREKQSQYFPNMKHISIADFDKMDSTIGFTQLVI